MNKLATFLSKKLATTGGAITLIASIDCDPNIKVLALAVVAAGYVLVQGNIDSKTPPPFDPLAGEVELFVEPENPCDDPALD